MEGGSGVQADSHPKGSSKISAILLVAVAGRGENRAQAWLCQQGTAQGSLARHKREQRQSLGSTSYPERSLHKGCFSAHASGCICSSGGSRSHTLGEKGKERKGRGRRLRPSPARRLGRAQRCPTPAGAAPAPLQLTEHRGQQPRGCPVGTARVSARLRAGK